MRFVLVHSPLVGPLTWQPVADRLRTGGHDVCLPVLQDRDDAGPTVSSRRGAWRERLTVPAPDSR